jgi:hypothetical protein
VGLVGKESDKGVVYYRATSQGRDKNPQLLDVHDPSTGAVCDYKFVKVPGKGLKPQADKQDQDAGPVYDKES